jgi:glyoxylase-like metal-dependent hydrolase (beta-lactamase superfamily II)
MSLAHTLDDALDRVSADPPLSVLAIRYGTVTMPRSEALPEDAHAGQPDGEATLDYYVWALVSPAGTVVIDTGFDADVGRRRGRTPLCDPVEALAACGVVAADVATVVLTHFHYDHVGNAHRFPAARLVVSDREFQFWRGPLADRLPFRRVVEAPEIDHIAARHAAGAVTCIEGRHRVAPGVEVVDVGGHTPGELVVAVSTADGPLVLAADAVHLQEELDDDRPFAIVANLEAFYDALAALRAVSKRGVPVIPGHEPAVFRTGRPAADGGVTSEHAVWLA